MKLILGIDTGGTCTDAVLYDAESGTVLSSAKAPTTPENLSLGIMQAIDSLPTEQLTLVGSVSLSTTLATNACVEGKGGHAGLVAIGGYAKVLQKIGPEYGLPPFEEIFHMEGGCDRFGENGDFHAESFGADLLAWAKNYDAVAVVEYNGIANPVNELAVRDFLTENTDLPVICGHELFQEKNFLGRAASALLNAKLLPVIQVFLSSIRSSLEERNIHAPTSIVRSDGTLMQAEFAGKRPVETIMCGPAASVLGGVFLTEEKNALLVDMGGTTTDIALVRDGVPVPSDNGVRIGRWKTFVHSVQIDTIGLGGDSLITRDRKGELQIGPRRAVPLSFAALEHPEILPELAFLSENRLLSTHALNEYLILKKMPASFASPTEEALCRLLSENGILQINRAAQMIGADVYNFRFDRLEDEGYLIRAGLTLTDLMHIRGDFTAFRTEAAYYGATFLAANLSMAPDAFVEYCYDTVSYRIYRQCILLELRLFHPEVFCSAEDGSMEPLIRSAWKNAKNQEEGFPSVFFRTKAAVIGLGAPAHAFLKPVADAFSTQCLIPEHAPVANAVGAASAGVSAVCTVEIKPMFGAGGIDSYTVLGSHPVSCEELEDAVRIAEQEAASAAEQEARRRGVMGNLSVSLARRDSNVRLGKQQEGQELFLGMFITATAQGKQLEDK